MKNDALKAALKQLLSHGEKAKDMSMMKFAEGKKKPFADQDMCPECQKPMPDGEPCECGYSKPVEGADEGDLASLLESGAQE